MYNLKFKIKETLNWENLDKPCGFLIFGETNFHFTAQFIDHTVVGAKGGPKVLV